MRFLRLFFIILLTVTYSFHLEAQVNPDILGLNGEVRAIAEDDQYIYIGGDFSHVCEGDERLSLIDLQGNLLLNDFNNNKSLCGDINSSVRLPGIGVILGGHFTLAGENINGQRVVLRNIALLRNDGTIDFDFNPVFDGPIHKMLLKDNGANMSLYVAGKYSQVRVGFDTVDVKNLSQLTLSFDPVDQSLQNILADQIFILFDDIYWSDHRVFKDLLLDTQGGRVDLYIAGEFTIYDEILDIRYQNLIRVNLLANTLEFTPRLNFGDPRISTSVNSIAIDGSDLYFAGNFNLINSFRGNNNQLNFRAGNLAKINDILNLNNNYSIQTLEIESFNSVVHKIAFHNNKLYVAGEFTNVSDGNIDINVASLVKLDTLNNGALERFNQRPFATRANSFEHKVFGMTVDGNFLYVFGEFQNFTSFGLGPNIIRIDIAANTVDENWEVRLDPQIIPKTALRNDNYFVLGTHPDNNKNSFFAIYNKNNSAFAPHFFEPNGPINDIEIYNSKIWLGGAFNRLLLKNVNEIHRREKGLFTINQNDLSFDRNSFIGFNSQSDYSANVVNDIQADPGRGQIIVAGNLKHLVFVGGNATYENALMFFDENQLRAPRQILNSLQENSSVESVLIQEEAIANNGQSVLILGGNFKVINNGVEEADVRNLAIFEENRFVPDRNLDLAFNHDADFKVYALDQNREESGLQLYVGGQLTQNIAADDYNGMIKINLNPAPAFEAERGQINPDFRVPLTDQMVVYDIAIDENLDIYFGGDFTFNAFGNAPVQNFAVLDLDGSLRSHYSINPNGASSFVRNFLVNDQFVLLGGLFSESTNGPSLNFLMTEKLLDRDNDTVLNDDDCNPNLITESRFIFEYLDNDQDGAPNIQVPANNIRCVGLIEEPVVPGFLWLEEEAQIFDCNDNNAEEVFEGLLLKDTDGDGYADSIDNADLIPACLNAARDIPVGFIEASDENIDQGVDCAPNDENLFNAVLLLPDRDNDGFVDNFEAENTRDACLNAAFDSPDGFIFDNNNRELDNCIDVPNPNQEDADADGIGDLCDCDQNPDICGDGLTCLEGICVDENINDPNPANPDDDSNDNPDENDGSNGGGGCSLSASERAQKPLLIFLIMSGLSALIIAHRKRIS